MLVNDQSALIATVRTLGLNDCNKGFEYQPGTTRIVWSVWYFSLVSAATTGSSRSTAVTTDDHGIHSCYILLIFILYEKWPTPATHMPEVDQKPRVHKLVLYVVYYGPVENFGIKFNTH